MLLGVQEPWCPWRRWHAGAELAWLPSAFVAIVAPAPAAFMGVILCTSGSMANGVDEETLLAA